MATQPLGATSSVTNVVDPSTCSVFVMTITDIDMANNVSRLMDASLQLLATVKLMETQLTKRKQSMSAQAVATVTERVYKQQEQITQEIQQHHAQQVRQQQQLQEKQHLSEKQELIQDENSEASARISDKLSDRQEYYESEKDKSPKSSSPQQEVAPKKENETLLDLTEATIQSEDELENDAEMTETIQSSL